jgi:hypothetical protein
MGCLMVFPVDSSDTVQAILGGSALRSVGLPEPFEGLALDATVEAMQRRLIDIPREISAAEVERRALLLPHADWLAATRPFVANSKCSARLAR